MARIIKIPLGDGTEANAIEQEFEIGREEWNEYKLVDGGRVRVRTSVLKIFRAVDESGKPLSGPDGDPIISVRHTIQVSASE